MRKFENMTIHCLPNEDTLQRLNTFGELGWEPWWRIDLPLASIVGNGSPGLIIIYLKREKQDA